MAAGSLRWRARCAGKAIRHPPVVEVGAVRDHVQRLRVVAGGDATGVVNAVPLATLEVRAVHAVAAHPNLSTHIHTAGPYQPIIPSTGEACNHNLHLSRPKQQAHMFCSTQQKGVQTHRETRCVDRAVGVGLITTARGGVQVVLLRALVEDALNHTPGSAAEGVLLTRTHTRTHAHPHP
jgi:hypothetical protein